MFTAFSGSFSLLSYFGIIVLSAHSFCTICSGVAVSFQKQ
jgi:hypothetical protein